MAQQLDDNCGDYLSVWNHYVYFQAGSKGLYRVPTNGTAKATRLDEYCGNLVVPGDGNVYFQSPGRGLYRVPCKGGVDAVQLHDECGDSLAVWQNEVYFQGTDGNLSKVPCGGGRVTKLYSQAKHITVPGDGYVYFQNESGRLYRVLCNGLNPQKLYSSGGYLVVHGDYVYFQADDGLRRVTRDGNDPKKLHDSAGHLAVDTDNYVYFQAGGDGLFRVPCDGSEQAKKLDPNCNHLVVFGDGWVYFQAGNKGLYRVRRDGIASAQQLDENCGNLVAANGYIYFQGGPNTNMLYRFGAAVPYAPPGFRARVQDEYVVKEIVGEPIEHKRTVIKDLIDEASNDATETWFVNFTSGASSGAYPDAVAARVNGHLPTWITAAKPNKNRLGTIVMDFPDDNGNTSLINTVFGCNSDAATDAANWMRTVDGDKKLSQLTIPGTHDTCTFNISSSISKCQNLTLRQQLDAGIRFIDIRCRNYYDTFELHHGSDYLGLNFAYVLNGCRDFLNAHEDECIIMSVKEEYKPVGNTKTFSEVFNGYVEKYKNELAWYFDAEIPQLAKVRKRIVLFRRFYVPPGSDTTHWGIDMTAWLENETFTWPYET